MIGIFDSGVGGLTVVKELIKKLPSYQFVYFGDTARAPYGNKSKEIITKYAEQDIDFLISQGARIIIIACNSASAVAANYLKDKYKNIPIFEVITPAVNHVTRVTKNNNIGVIGTQATINSGVYNKQFNAIKKGYKIFNKPCPLFVPLAEEGMAKNPATKIIAKQYLLPLKNKQIDTLILGCTHYPILKDVIQQKIGQRVKLIDPAEQTILELKLYLNKYPELEKSLSKSGENKYYFSDISAHLPNMINQWLDKKIKPELHQI